MAIRHANLLLASATALLVVACGGAPQNSAEVDQRAAELEQREAELAAREAALAAAQAAQPVPEPVPAPVAATPKPAPKPAPVASKPVVNKPVASAPKPPDAPAPPPPPRVVTVSSGTQLPLALASDLSSKTAQVGDRVRASLTSDVLVDGRVALARGTIVSGQVINVVSGSRKIGGVPMIGLRFDQIELPGGASLPIAGEITEKGKSDTGRDSAKIAGGAAAGAIIGNQIGHGDGNKIIGGILGGAIGAAAAHRTGTEVELPAGTALAIALSSPLEVTLR